MKSVTIGEAKNKLSALLRLVGRGESVLILNRDRPVARLEPVAPRNDDERLAELDRKGIIRRGTKPLPRDFLSRKLPSPQSGSSVVDILLAERREAR